MKKCAEIIRELCEDKDLKQLEVAKIIGTTQQHYSNYETGAHEPPAHVLEMLADYYNVSTDFLMGRTDCKEGVSGLNTKVNEDYTAGAVISDILSLNADGRAAVIEYIEMRKLKKSRNKKK